MWCTVYMMTDVVCRMTDVVHVTDVCYMMTDVCYMTERALPAPPLPPCLPPLRPIRTTVVRVCYLNLYCVVSASRDGTIRCWDTERNRKP